MSQLLPIVPQVFDYRVGTTLDGTSYVFDFRWNDRDGAWYMDISTEDEEIIERGVKVVLGSRHRARRTVSAEYPIGIFIASDQSSAGIDAGFDDFGTRVQLFYIPLAELQERLASL